MKCICGYEKKEPYEIRVEQIIRKEKDVEVTIQEESKKESFVQLLGVMRRFSSLPGGKEDCVLWACPKCGTVKLG